MGLWSRFMTWLRSLFLQRQLQLAIIGLQNAGKSTYVNVLATQEYQQDTIPTIGFNFRQIRKGKVQFQLWDLAGQPKFRDSWEKYCRNADCIIFIVDSVDYGNLQVARAQLHKLLSWPSLQNIPLLVLGNKNDLEGALSEQELITAMSLQQVIGRPVACYSVSSKNMVNIDTTLNYLTNLQKRS